MAESIIEKRGGLDLLWEGTWTSGEIIVPRSAKYSVFMIVQESSYGGLGIKAPTGTVRASSMVMSSSGIQTIYSFRASASGNTWTMGLSKKLAHNPSGNHGTASDVAVNAIYGVI